MNLLRRLRRKGNFQSHEILLVTSVLVRPPLGRFAMRTYFCGIQRTLVQNGTSQDLCTTALKKKTLKFIAHKAIIIIEIRNGTDASW